MKLYKMCSRKRRNTALIVTSVVIIAYVVAAIVPNVFASKGITPDKIKNMQIIAHRGGAGIGLENTLSCIEKGIAAGATMIEIDIHLTKDGHLVVCHDETVDRTTNGKGKIRNMTMGEIGKLRIIDTEERITDQHIPMLSEVLSLVDGRARLLIEVKRTRNIYQGIEQKLIDEIEQFQASSWVIVQSFNDSVLENVHRIAPGLRLEKLVLFKLPGLPVIFDGSFSKYNFKKYHYISSFNIFHLSASRRWINNIHKQGKEVKIWTVNGPDSAPDLDVEGVITDRPDLW